VKLIVGLGNPGKEYEMTRHNLGFLVIDRLTLETGTTQKQRKFNAILTRGRMGGEQVILMKPLTYMNLSGGAVKKASEYFHLPLQDLIVVHDDLDLDFGRFKIKKVGGDAGHKGIRSIIDHVGDDSFVRVRIGIGRPEKGGDVVDYVLDPLNESERSQLPEVLDQGSLLIQTLIKSGVDEAMHTFHRKKTLDVRR
jgi:PTH1 family peptidyl-tRNA hydrolase